MRKSHEIGATSDVLPLAASVRTGRVSACVILKRLGAYPRQNGLALTLREVGRIERMLYTPYWLEQPQLHRQAVAELNKDESRNALPRAVCFHRLGRLHDARPNCSSTARAALLWSAAIVLWTPCARVG